jgi:multidrug efflux pump subunit AcrA (membrane-fusion protein)
MTHDPGPYIIADSTQYDEPQSSLVQIPASLDDSTNSNMVNQRESIPWWILLNIGIPVLLLTAGAGVFVALGKVTPQERESDNATLSGRIRALPEVKVALIQSLEESEATLRLNVDGTVVPYREVRVATEVAGEIVEKSPACEAGTFVTAGQVLMRINPTDYELDVDRLTRLKEQEYQALRELDQEEVNTKRMVELAEQDTQLQQRELNRRESLPDGFSSQGEVDQATRAVVAAQQQRQSLQNQLELLRKRRVRLEASERLAQTQLKVAKVNLARTEIKSPIDGVIVSEQAELNSFVTRGSTVVTIEDTSRVEVATSLRMDQLHWILDQPATTVDQNSRGYDLPETPAVIEYEVAGRPGVVYRWNGRLLRYNGIGLDPKTRTIPVRVVVDDPRVYVDENGTCRERGNTALVRGMFVRVKLLIKPRTPLVVIPALALKPGNRVWLFDADPTVLDAKSVTNLSNHDPSANSSLTTTDPVTSRSPIAALLQLDDWTVGNVIVQDGIVPVDSVEVEGDTDSQSRHWVCEVRGGSVTSGSLAVVSPLGNIEAGRLPARVASKSIATSGKTADSDAAQKQMPVPESSK